MLDDDDDEDDCICCVSVASTIPGDLIHMGKLTLPCCFIGCGDWVCGFRCPDPSSGK